MAIATLRIQVTVEDESGVRTVVDKLHRWATAAAVASGDRRTYSISAAAFQALTVPTGAKVAIIEFPTSAEDMLIKGITGDTGVDATPTTSPLGLTAIVPLGDSPSIGLTNSGAGTEVIPATFL